jgi:hypothetical protein
MRFVIGHVTKALVVAESDPDMVSMPRSGRLVLVSAFLFGHRDWPDIRFLDGHI